MFIIEKINFNWIERMAIKILKNGPVPRHIGIMMDGNRRYAKAQGLSIEMGQKKGFNVVMNVFQWCVALGIPIVTAYGMSVRNLKRSKEEVEILLRMIEQSFRDLIDHKEQLKEWGVQIRVIAEFPQVPQRLLKLIAKVMMVTKNNNKSIFNIVLLYTSTHEMTRTVKDILEGVEKAQILPDDISEDLISACLYTGKLPEPDLIIRTSGEIRLSEFVLWQSEGTCLYFAKVFWPEISIWDLMAAVFHYQHRYKDLKEIKQMRPSLVSSMDNSRIMNFVNELHRRRKRAIEKISLGSTQIYTF